MELCLRIARVDVVSRAEIGRNQFPHYSCHVRLEPIIFPAFQGTDAFSVGDGKRVFFSMILSPDQLQMQQSEVWKGSRRITRTIADCPLSGNPQGSVHDQHVGDRRLSAPVLLNRQAGQRGKRNVSSELYFSIPGHAGTKNATKAIPAEQTK